MTFLLPRSSRLVTHACIALWGAGLCALAPAVHASRVYVSNEDEHTVTVLDTERLEAVGTIEVGKRPRGLKLNQDQSRLYVAVSGLPKCPPSVPDADCAKLQRDLHADGVAVVDTRTLKVLKVLAAGSDPEQFDVSREGRLFVSNEDSSTLTVLELRTGAVLARIPVGKEPEGVSLAPDERLVLVTNESDGTISMIDTRTLKVVRTLSVGKRPRDIAFTPDGHTAYVSGEFDSSLYRIGIAAGAPIERLVQLRKEARPMAVRLDVARKRLYVSTGRGGTVAVVSIDGKAAIVTEVPVGARPWGLALAPDGSRLYTANGPSNDVSVLDTATLKVIKKIPVGRSPWGVVVAR